MDLVTNLLIVVVPRAKVHVSRMWRRMQSRCYRF